MSKERKKAKAFAVKEMSLYIRARDKRCVICGSTETLENGHLITCAREATRFDLKNCNCQCHTCNGLHERDPEPYTVWWVERYGREALEELVLKSNQVRLYTVDELMELGKSFRQMRKELAGN